MPVPRKLYGLAACAFVLVACGSEPTPEPTPTLQPTPPPIATEVPSPQPTPTRTRHPVPVTTPTLDALRGAPSRAAITTTYAVRAGDTLSGIAIAVGMSTEELQRINGLRNPNALRVGQELLILREIKSRAPSIKLVPDSEVVNGPSAAEFDLQAYVARQRGYLSRYIEEVAGETLTGAQIVGRVAEQFSVHPRILLAALEHVGGWVTQAQPDPDQLRYPLGYKRANLEGLNVQMTWAAARLNEGYYGLRLGTRDFVRLDGGDYASVGDGVNAGTAAVQNYLAAVYPLAAWAPAVEAGGERAFVTTYRRLFGEPWQYDFGPPVPPDVQQPPLALPWAQGELWFFTGGPHATWGNGTPWGALDFTTESVSGCSTLPEWVTAMADGAIARSTKGEVAQALDPSGDERIGWSVLYLHLATDGRVQAGTRVRQGDRLGHPSCEGGLAIAAHVHVARKYNGEWITAQGDIPFVLGGWVAGEGDAQYEGTLTRGQDRREACECKLPLVNGVQ